MTNAIDKISPITIWNGPLHFYTLQLVRMAGMSSIAPVDIWEHFETVIAPEIRCRQVPSNVHSEQHRSLGELLTDFCHAVPAHEV